MEPDQVDVTVLEGDVLALDRQVCFLLSVASRSVVGIYRPLLERLRLTHPQYLVMLALWERSPRSVVELSSTLHQDPATLSPLLKRLEAVGYVSRSRDVTDGRLLMVDLTAAGHALREQAEEVPPQVVSRLGMEPAELQQLHATLSSLLTAVGTDQSPSAAR